MESPLQRNFGGDNVYCLYIRPDDPKGGQRIQLEQNCRRERKKHTLYLDHIRGDTRGLVHMHLANMYLSLPTKDLNTENLPLIIWVE